MCTNGLFQSYLWRFTIFAANFLIFLKKYSTLYPVNPANPVKNSYRPVAVFRNNPAMAIKIALSRM